MNNRVILALLLLFCTFLPVVGQTQPAAPATPVQRPQNQQSDDKDEVVKITTNLVQIDAVVTKDGKPVPNLKAEDFEIYEDGRRQEITSFAYISNVPNVSSTQPPATTTESKTTTVVPAAPVKRDVPRRTIALVVDDLGLSVESMNQARRQVRKFLAEQMQPNDLVAIIRTGGEMGALQQFTNDKRLLNRAVDQLRWNYCSRTGVTVLPREGAFSFRGDNRDPCGGMSLLATMKAVRFILDAMGQLPGRKSMILMSDSLPIEDQEGELTDETGRSLSVGGNRTDYGHWLRKVAEKAIRSSVVIYSVDTQGLQYTGVTAADSIPVAGMGGGDIVARSNALLRVRSRMLDDRRAGGELIAKQTGGFQVRNSNDFQFDRIVEDQSGYYLLGYRPTEETFNRRFHHIKAKVKRSGMTVRTRFGFFGVSEEEAQRTRYTPADMTNLALMSPFGAQDIEFDLTSFFADDQTEGALVRSFVYLDAKSFTFTPVNDKYETSFEIHGVLFGDNGAIVEQVRQGASLSLRQNEYKHAMQAGLRLNLDMPAKRPGAYQVRVAVRDKASSKIGSAGQFVAVPDLKNKRLAASGIVLRDVADASAPNVVMANPDARRFPANRDFYFALMIYNATINPATQLPNLAMQLQLFRDGKSIRPPVETTIDVANQPDLSRIFTSGVLKAGPDLVPGSYYLQVAIIDQTSKNKQPPVVQWVDFEIVK